jgi:hypothetical protein
MMTTKSHAQTINEQYNKTESNFISLNDRLKEALDLSPMYNETLKAVVDEFKRRNSQWTKFSDLHLCEAVQVAMKDIWIDTTMQRNVNMEHITDILQYFSETMVMPIQVYKDGDRYIAWDGQHTAIVLYIVLTRVFGERLADAIIPVVVYSTKQKTEIRRNFILLNGNAKKPLEFIDIYKQQVYGVKVDGSKDTEWQATALKNDHFAEAGLFVTNNKFGDEDQPGAFTLLADTLMSKSLKTRKDPEVAKMFAQYWIYLNQKRPVDPKEARQLFEYFNLCHEQGIKVDEQYLLDFVAFTKDYFEADFSPNGPFWQKVSQAYSHWYIKKNEGTDDLDKDGNIIVRGFTTEMRCGIPFIIAQLRKSTKLKTPKYTPNNGFIVSKEMLW